MTLRFDLQQELARIQKDRQQRDANIISQHLQRQKQLYRSLTPLVNHPQTKSITTYSNSLRKYQSQNPTQIQMQITNFVKGAFENLQQSVCDFIVKNSEQQKKIITEELSTIRKEIQQLKRDDNCDTEASRSTGLENYYLNNRELKGQFTNMKKQDCPQNKEMEKLQSIPPILQLKQNNGLKNQLAEDDKLNLILKALNMMKNENQEQKKQKVKKQSKKQKKIDQSFQQTEEARPKKIKRKQSDAKIESKENKDQKGKTESRKKIKQQSVIERKPSIDDRIKKSKVTKEEQSKRQEDKVVKQSRKKSDSKQSIGAELKKKKKDAKNDKQSDMQKSKSKSKIKDSKKKLQQVDHKGQKQKKKANYQDIVDPADLLKLVNKKTSGPSKDKNQRASKIGEQNKKINESVKDLNKQKKGKKETNKMNESQVKEEKNKKKRSDSVASQQKDNKKSTLKNIPDQKARKKDKENKLGESVSKISKVRQSVKKVQKSDSKADVLKKGSKAKIHGEEEKKEKKTK